MKTFNVPVFNGKALMCYMEVKAESMEQAIAELNYKLKKDGVVARKTTLDDVIIRNKFSREGN